MVLLFYRLLEPRTTVVCNWCRETCNNARFVTDANMQVTDVNVRTGAAEQTIVIEDSRGTHDAAFQTEHAGSALLEDRSEMPSYSRL